MTFLLAAGRCLAIAALFFAPSLAAQNLCDQLRRSSDPAAGLRQPEAVDRNDDLAVATVLKNQLAAGRVDYRYDEVLGTNIFFTATAKPKADGTIPISDPEAKALYIFFHGSGTEKAGGKNFIDKMNDVASLGYAALSFDMPYHQDGPRDPSYGRAEVFVTWVRQIIQTYRIARKPVYLVGHSFGPDVISEVMSRYPSLVDGAVEVSPAGFTPELRDWYENHTSRMNFGGDTKPNEAGGQWADAVSSQFRWNRGAPDPTVLNPNLRVRILTGDMEEYVPAPLESLDPIRGVPTEPNTYDLCRAIRAFFSRSTCTLERGVGHYIFQHNDRHGFNVIMREILLIDGKEPADAKAMRIATAKKPRSTSESLGQKFARDRIFRDWAISTHGERTILRLVGHKEDPAALSILNEYDAYFRRRSKVLLDHIRATRDWAPEFFSANKAIIDKISLDNLEGEMDILTRYIEFLETLPESLRRVHARDLSLGRYRRGGGSAIVAEGIFSGLAWEKQVPQP